MSILIWDLEIIDFTKHETIQHVYFFTKRSAKRYAKEHEKEWEENGWTWTYGGEPLYFGRVRD